jgi:hypothetical protein
MKHLSTTVCFPTCLFFSIIILPPRLPPEVVAVVGAVVVALLQAFLKAQKREQIKA